jgi:hypothetical protein
MANQHRIAVIRQVTNALRKTFDADYPDIGFRVVYTGPNFQMEPEKYPAVYVAYGETSLQSAGLGHRIAAVDEDGMDRLLKQSIAQGTIQFTVMALTPFERDSLLDAVSDLLLFSKDGQISKSVFWKEIHDEDFLSLVLNTENVMPGGVSSQQAPWQSSNDLIFTGSYAVSSKAEFFSDFETSEFVPINRVRALPYRPDQPVPTGANDPAPWN